MRCLIFRGVSFNVSSCTLWIGVVFTSKVVLTVSVLLRGCFCDTWASAGLEQETKYCQTALKSPRSTGSGSLNDMRSNSNNSSLLDVLILGVSSIIFSALDFFGDMNRKSGQPS